MPISHSAFSSLSVFTATYTIFLIFVFLVHLWLFNLGIPEWETDHKRRWQTLIRLLDLTVCVTQVNLSQILEFNPLLVRVCEKSIRHDPRLCLHQQDLGDTMHTVTLLHCRTLPHWWTESVIIRLPIRASLGTTAWLLCLLWQIPSSCIHNSWAANIANKNIWAGSEKKK